MRRAVVGFPSQLVHRGRRALSTKPKLAAVHQGVQFEERSHSVLRSQLSMTLTRVGGKSDGGIDLQGWWWLPPTVPDAAPVLATGWPDDPLRRRLRVLGQCKAERIKLGPHYVREMEGVMLALNAEHAAASHGHPAAVALLVSESGFTRGGLERARQSRVPFFLMHLPPLDVDVDRPEAIGGCIWNPVLASMLGSDFEVRWERSLDTRASSRPGLWWKGARLRSWTPEDDDVEHDG
ncbi:hypothetical protein EXIGLDRAFT_611656 [Exidia glandulosa HHB12029]|uniref:Restriction endonuclease type IV Mrr domain-containing protein n=1 Tax=Exidia glandulosa HHB12029 TaxID=1314781 RepID=A0A165J8Y1_EXIGL|nr:hypothetical protein EXIGLDRAFT_611656 [Exidia glandulosa HHB12029]